MLFKQIKAKASLKHPAAKRRKKQQKTSHQTKTPRRTTRHFSTTPTEGNSDGSNSGGGENAEQSFVTHQQYMRATKRATKQDQAHYEQMMQRARQQQQEEQSATPGDMEMVEDDDAPLTAEELFYDMPPLSTDMYQFEPREHKGTLIWLPDCFETHDQHSRSFQMLMPKQLRVVIPNPPTRECTVLGGEEQKAWYDVMTVPFQADAADMDYTGMKLSMYMIHQLIRDEAIRIGQKIAPFNSSPEVVEMIGTERIFLGGFGQGAAAALFAALRYPKQLAGVVSHSGYIPFINQTADAARMLQQQLKTKYDTDHAELLSKEDHEGVKALTEKFKQNNDIYQSAPNLKTPIYVFHNATDNVIPWCELAQPTFINAVKAPLKCKLNLRMGKSEGHSIASLDLLDIQFWTTNIIGEKEREKLPEDMFERETMVELGEFGDSVIVVDKYSPHADRVTMPWTSPKVLDSANVAQQDINRVKELLSIAQKHPDRVDEIAEEIDQLNRNADDHLWKAYLSETLQFVKNHQSYMSDRRAQEGLKWQREQREMEYQTQNTSEEHVSQQTNIQQEQRQQQHQQQDQENAPQLNLFEKLYAPDNHKSQQ